MWPIYKITAKFQNGVILIKFWKLAFNYATMLSIDAKLFYESFENFGTTLLFSKSDHWPRRWEGGQKYSKFDHVVYGWPTPIVEIYDD